MIFCIEIIVVDVEIIFKEFGKIFMEIGFFKILVFKDNIDDIMGYVYSFELFKNFFIIKKVLMFVVFVLEIIWVKDIFNILIRKWKSFVVVIDEYGGMVGLIIVEDIIEEFFGEIEDEYDLIELIEEEFVIDYYKFFVWFEVDYLNEEYNFDFLEGENYEILGGFIVNFIEEILEKNEIVDIEGYIFKILEVFSIKIELVELKK